MQKKISLFLLISFLSLTLFVRNSELRAESICIDQQETMMDDIMFDDDISLDELVALEKEMIQKQPPGFSYKEKLRLFKFAIENPSFTFDYLKQQSDEAQKKANRYFDTHKKAYAFTITSGILIILLALALKIINEDQISSDMSQ
jgi:hypothetical protein